MNPSRLTYLFYAYFNKTATDGEKEELAEALLQPENREQVSILLEAAWKASAANQPFFTEAQSQQMLAGILQRNPAIQQKTKRFSMPKLVAAASLVIVLATAGYIGLHPAKTKPVVAVQKPAPVLKETIKPGSSKALLTLSDGSNIVLDAAKNGALAQQGNTDVIKLTGEAITYKQNAAGPSLYNTLSTPAGGQYGLTLADGTKVWLNAASSLYFPVSFSGKERTVKLTGEAYFEVAKNAVMPFIVEVNDAAIQVLGTHFDVMAYTDENSLNTTLLEGSVKVIRGTLQTVIKPGQQSKIGKDGSITVADANVEEAIAWKNGYFEFNSYDIQKIMRQIARWYNVEVVYGGKIPEGHFSGLINRNNDITGVLQILKSGDVHFKIEGRKIIVE